MPDTRSSSALVYHGTVSSSVLQLTTLVTSGAFVAYTVDQVAAASRLFISCDTGALRVFWDSTNTLALLPTIAIGLIVPAANYPWLEIVGNNNIRNLRLIRSSSTDCVVNLMLENQ